MGWRAAWRALTQGERKASAAGPLLALHHVGRPVWTPRRFDKLAEEGYRRNIIAFRCVDMTAKAAAMVPWLLFQRKGGSLVELESHPLLTLLARPNPGQGGAALREAFFAYLLIAGNSFLEAVGPNGAPPRELWALRPDRVRVIPGRLGLPSAYELSLGGAKKRFQVDAVNGTSPLLHAKTFHPLDDWYGMSPIEAAAFAIDQHNAAGAWNKALLDGGARPSGALVYAPRDGEPALSDEQFERLKEQIERQHAGSANAGRPMLLEGGLEWREMSLSPKDMDWIAGKDMSAREIALAYNVPPQLVGIPDSQTYNNNREARLAFYDDAVLPLVEFFRAELNNWLTPAFGAGLELRFDEDGIEALSLRRERKWRAIATANFLTTNEKRAAVGYEPVDGGDVIHKPGGGMPAARSGNGG
jgi:HK97 family phage portal protein